MCMLLGVLCASADVVIFGPDSGHGTMGDILSREEEHPGRAEICTEVFVQLDCCWICVFLVFLLWVVCHMRPRVSAIKTLGNHRYCQEPM